MSWQTKSLIGAALGKLRRRLARSDKPKRLLRSRGHRGFLRVEREAEPVVDGTSVAEQAHWDKLYGAMTNLARMPAGDVLGHCAALRQVERTFPVTEHDLKARPSLHWTERRFRTHLAIAFMTLLCVRHPASRTRRQQHTLPEEVIRRALTAVQCSVIQDRGSGHRRALPSAMSPAGSTVGWGSSGCKSRSN